MVLFQAYSPEMGQQWVLRLVGSDDELRFQMGSVQAIVFW